MPRSTWMCPLRWSDMDAFGHVNNVQFLRYLEDARILAFSAHQSDHGASMLETGILVARHEIEYVAPLTWRPEPVSIDLWVTSIGGASFEVGYEVYDEGGAPSPDRTVYVRAESTMVVFDLAENRTRRLTAGERAVVTGLLDDPVAFRRRRSA